MCHRYCHTATRDSELPNSLSFLLPVLALPAAPRAVGTNVSAALLTPCNIVDMCRAHCCCCCPLGDGRSRRRRLASQVDCAHPRLRLHVASATLLPFPAPSLSPHTPPHPNSRPPTICMRKEEAPNHADDCGVAGLSR